jgi:hypothetical protein
VSFNRLSSLLALTFIAKTAGAATIDFTTVPGNDGDLFTTFTENRFEVTAIGGTWSVSKSLGNPAPAIFTQSFGAIQVDGAPFSFKSVDIDSPGGLVTIIGVFGNSQIFRGSFVGGPDTFQPVVSPSGNELFTYLIISINMVNGGTGYIDNIVLSPVHEPVPEPSSVILVSAGLLTLALRARMTR